MTIALVIAAAACIGLNFGLLSHGLNVNGRNGLSVVVLTIIWWGLPLAAACYLLTLATGWQP
jgi:hypothetical protein